MDGVVLRLCGGCARPIPRSERWCSDGCAARAVVSPSGASPRPWAVTVDPAAIMSSAHVRPLWPPPPPVDADLERRVAEVYPQALMCLPGRQRAVWVFLREPWCLSQAELACQWGVSQQAVAKLLAKARVNLARALAPLLKAG